MAGGVGAADRIGLAEQVVGEPDLGVGVGAAELDQRGASPRADLGFLDPEQRAEVGVALAALEQQLEHRVLVWVIATRGRKPTL